MFAALSPAEFALAIMAPATVVYLLLLFLTLRLSRSLERSLIACGLLTAVYAVWHSLTTAETAVQVRAGLAGVSFGADATGILGRIAVLLILSGLAVILVGAVTERPAYREERIRE
jgi:lysophospholipid acyltransferase (LPLAT)-like uncharacterized protein